MRLPDGVTLLDPLRGYSVEWTDDDGYLLSKGSAIFRSSTLTPPFQLLGRFPVGLSQELSARLRILARVLRFGYSNVLYLSRDRLFGTFQKKAGLLTPEGFLEIFGPKRLCRFLPGGCAVDADGTLFLGEYWSNSRRSSVCIYRLSSESDELEIAYQFPEGSIRHIHGVFVDPFEQDLWCLTGDRGNECQILRSADGFKSFETVGGGDESWRAVSLQFRKAAVYYGSDAEYQENFLYRIDRRTGTRSRLSDLDGPVYFSTHHQGVIVMGVAAEGCPSQPVSQASLWVISAGDRVSRILSVPKDLYPLSLMAGTFRFPLGPGNREIDLIVNCCALRGLDNVPLCVKGELLGLSRP